MVYSMISTLFMARMRVRTARRRFPLPGGAASSRLAGSGSSSLKKRVKWEKSVQCYRTISTGMFSIDSNISSLQYLIIRLIYCLAVWFAGSCRGRVVFHSMTCNILQCGEMKKQFIFPSFLSPKCQYWMINQTPQKLSCLRPKNPQSTAKRLTIPSSFITLPRKPKIQIYR